MARQHGRKPIVVLGGRGREPQPQTRQKHDVILVDKRVDHPFMPAFLFVMVGERQPQDVARGLKRLERHNVKFVQAEVSGIDRDLQQVEVQNRILGTSKAHNH